MMQYGDESSIAYIERYTIIPPKRSDSIMTCTNSGICLVDI